MKVLILLLTLTSTYSFAQKFNNILKMDIMDLELGAGYVAGTNWREEFDGEANDSYNGFSPLGRARLLFIEFGNVPGVINYNHDGFAVGTLAYYTGHPYDAGGIEDRDSHFFGGAFIGFNWFTIYGYSDIGDDSNGTVYAVRASPMVGKPYGGELFLVLQAKLYNRHYVDYFFGISQEDVDASANFSSVYIGDDTYAGEAGFQYNKKLGSDWRFTIWTFGEWFDKGIGDSPTVKNDFFVNAGIGWLYTFF